MSAQLLLGVIIALLLLANWLALYSRSDNVYQFKDGEMKVVTPQLQNDRKTSGVNRYEPMLSKGAIHITARQFGILEDYFNQAAGLCPSQRVKVGEPSIAQQDSFLVNSISAEEFRFSLNQVLRLNTATKSILDVRAR
jgi:hypothetical protein